MEALRQNDRILNQIETAERATLEVEGARNAFEPKVVPNIRGSFGQSDVSDQAYRVDVSKRFVTGTEMRLGVGASTAQIPGLDGLQDIRFYNTDTTLSLSQPLLKGFGRTVSRRTLTVAELRREDARRQATLTEHQVTVDVATAYYRVVAQEALVRVARQSFDRSRQLRDASEAKLDAGLVSQLDVLRAQQLVSQAELQLFDAQGASEDAKDQLRFLIGREAEASLNLVSEIPTVIEPISPEEAVDRAMANRLDLESARREAADADQAVDVARNHLLPQVDLNLAMTRRQTSDAFARSFGLNGFQLATFLNISMPVDRTPQTIEFQTALIARDRRRRDIELMQRRIGDDVRRQVRDRERAIRNRQAAEANVQIARREVDVARLRYDRGLSNNLDVVTAESNLLAAESRAIVTSVDLAVNRLSLLATMGVLNPRRDVAAE